jgi:uncharacterized membrane protein
MDFWKGVFSEGGPGSASRVLSALFGVTVCACFAYVTIHNHALPPAGDVLAAGTFAATPYAINQAKAAISSLGGKQ